MPEQIDKKPATPKRAGLGRGLGSLLGGGTFDDSIPVAKPTPATAATPAAKVAAQAAATPVVQAPAGPQAPMELPIEQVVPNKEQPRRKFSEIELKELSDSIKQKGIIQPIIVRKLHANEYQIIAGERRWRAAQLAGLKRVPVVLKTVDVRETLELALIENIQRQDLNPLEEAEAYNLLIEKYHLTQQQLAERVGKDRATVANVLRLVRLPKEVRELIKDGQLSLGQAKVLLAVDDLGIQKKLARRAARTQMSVRALEKLIKRVLGGAESADEAEIKIESLQPNDKHLRELALNLQRTLGTKVEIDFNGRRGAIKIDFYSLESLNSLASRLQRGAE